MTAKKGKLVFSIINICVFFLLFFLHYCNFFSIKIVNANPFVPLAFLIAISMFCSESTAFFAGLTFGIIVDTDAATHFGFNSITFMIIGLATAFTVHYLFNNNIRSCIMLSLICCSFYFIVRWLVFYAFTAGFGYSLNYLLTITLPSIAYTTVFVIPFYFFEKFLRKKLY